MLSRRLAGVAAVWVIGAVVLRVTLLAPEICEPISAVEARRAAVAATEWIAVNQAEDGRYLYEYDRSTATVIDDYNLVRHAGTTMALYQLILAGETQLLPAADRGVAFMIERLVPTGSTSIAFAEPDTDPKLGATALFAISLALRRQATDDATNDNLLRRLGLHLAQQQRGDGAMLNFWRRSTEAPDPNVTSRYATGEALWAMALLHGVFPDDGWDEPAWQTLDYLATERDAEEDLFPQPWPDQWASYSLGEMVDWGLEEHHIAYARALAGQFGVQVRWDAQRRDVASLTHGPPIRGAGFGTVLEGLGALLHVADVDPRMADLRVPIATRLACGASLLEERQVGADDVEVEEAAERELGAWFLDERTRVDDQQHAASGLQVAERVLTGERP